MHKLIPTIPIPFIYRLRTNVEEDSVCSCSLFRLDPSQLVQRQPKRDLRDTYHLFDTIPSGDAMEEI